MDRKCNSTRCIEFNEAILADVIDLRKDILGNLMKAEKIIGLLGGTPLTSVLTAAAEIKDEETSAEDSTAYLDQGLRLNASDYTNDVVGLGKAGVGVFNKGHRKSRIDGNDIDLILAGDQTSSVIGRGSTSSATPSKKMSRSPLPARTPKIIRESNDSGDFDSRFGSAMDIDAMLSASGDDVVQESIAVPVLPQPSIYAKTSDPIAYTPTYAKAFGLPTTARDFKSVHSGTPKAGQSGKQLNQLQYSDYSNKTKEISEAPGNFGSVGNVASQRVCSIHIPQCSTRKQRPKQQHA
ncbi:hypothetical protein BDR26DRAFT_10162 [Obelidium mucronatum]|nr:hypothetical protein BDR26DRAFT_10162 [Obelidium mucronatum]